MLLDPENWYLGYSQIVKDCHETEGSSCLILCHSDVDAIAAARIWTYMLRNDGINYQLHPCNSYSQLARILSSSSVVDETICAVVLLNVGSGRNLTKLLFAPYKAPAVPSFGRSEGGRADAEEQPATPVEAAASPLLPLSSKVYVLDCRRPVHLANVYAGENVVIFWDSVQEQYQRESLPSDGDNLSGNDSSSSEEEDDVSASAEEDSDDDDDDAEEHEFGDDVEPTEATEHEEAPDEEPDVGYEAEVDEHGRGIPGERFPKRRRIKSKKDHQESVDETSVTTANSSDGEEEKDADADAAAGKADAGEERTTGEDVEPARPDESQPQLLSARELHTRRRQRLRAYYATGSFYGSPAAYIAHRVSTQLRFGDVGDLLWFACVGVTDAFLHARLDVAGYTSLAMDLRTHCSRLFPNDMYSRVESSVFAERLVGSSREVTKIAFSENGRVISETDFRFFLLRHSSLMDAMRYSDFVSTKLQLLSSQGMHRLHELLATMGYPLSECNQPFPFMKTSLRRRLRENIRAHAEAFGLDSIEYTSFFRVTGYQSLLSASDTTYAITALLEREPPASRSEEEGDRDAFNMALDVLNTNSQTSSNSSELVNGANLPSSGFGEGIRLAKEFQKGIFATCANLNDRNGITGLVHFRYALITCTSKNYTEQQIGSASNEDDSSFHQHHIFAKPLALTRLAHYIMDWHRENGKWVGDKALPLVLCAEKPPNSFLVAGFEYPESAGHFYTNRFGRNFELAATSMQGSFRLDGFDSHIIEVAGRDVQRFLEQLHYLMESSMSVSPDIE